MSGRVHRWLVVAGLLWAALVSPSAGAVAAQSTEQGRQTPYGIVRDPTFSPLPGATVDYGYYSGGASHIELPATGTAAS